MRTEGELVDKLPFRTYHRGATSHAYGRGAYQRGRQVYEWDCVAAVERLTVLHYSVDCICLSFGIMGFIVEL